MWGPFCNNFSSNVENQDIVKDDVLKDDVLKFHNGIFEFYIENN